MNKMNALPYSQRPREKMLDLGPSGLSNVELLAIVLGKGQRGKDVITLAEEVMEKLGSLETELDLEMLQEIRGIGFAKGCQILASIEFSRRFLTTKRKIKIRTPKDALPMLTALRMGRQESVVVLTLDGNNQIIKMHSITLGLANQSQIHPRETFFPAIEDRAVSIMVAHNHPSGNLEPSESDLIATRRLVEVSKTMGIPILDHLIVSEFGFMSLRERFPAYFI